jgi:stage III sporulation protein AF
MDLDWLFELLKRLVFGSIIIAIVEILVPDGGLKKYYNYISSLIILTILFTPFLNLDTAGVLSKKNFDNTFKDHHQTNFELEFNENKKVFLERSLETMIDQEMKRFLMNHYRIVPVEANVFVQSSEDFTNVEIREIEITLKKGESIPPNLLHELEDQYGVPQDNIKLLFREEEEI